MKEKEKKKEKKSGKTPVLKFLTKKIIELNWLYHFISLRKINKHIKSFRCTKKKEAFLQLLPSFSQGSSLRKI